MDLFVVVLVVVVVLEEEEEEEEKLLPPPTPPTPPSPTPSLPLPSFRPTFLFFDSSPPVLSPLVITSPSTSSHKSTPLLSKPWVLVAPDEYEIVAVDVVIPFTALVEDEEEDEGEEEDERLLLLLFKVSIVIVLLGGGEISDLSLSFLFMLIGGFGFLFVGGVVELEVIESLIADVGGGGGLAEEEAEVVDNGFTLEELLLFILPIPFPFLLYPILPVLLLLILLLLFLVSVTSSSLLL